VDVMQKRYVLVAAACLLIVGVAWSCVVYVPPWREEQERRRVLREALATIMARGGEAFADGEHVFPWGRLLPQHLRTAEYLRQATIADVLRSELRSSLVDDEIEDVVPRYRIFMEVPPGTFDVFDPGAYDCEHPVGTEDCEVRWVTSVLLTTRNRKHLKLVFTGANDYVGMAKIDGQWHLSLDFRWCAISEVQAAE
jgi:hypothetical protein